MRIGVDFDDVLYPYHSYLKRRILKRYGVDLSKHRVTTFYYEQDPALASRGITRDQVWAEVQATWNEVNSHEEAGLLDADAPRILKGLARRHRIVIVSARTSDSEPHVRRFLQRHGIRPYETRMGQKEKSGFDILIDDFPPHAVENAAVGGWSILYTIDENSTFNETKHPRILRAHSWKDVAAAVGRIERARIA